MRAASLSFGGIGRVPLPNTFVQCTSARVKSTMRCNTQVRSTYAITFDLFQRFRHDSSVWTQSRKTGGHYHA